VVGIMSADLAIKANTYEFSELVVGDLVVGGAVMLLKIFYEIVRTETETGTHLRLNELAAISREAIFVMAFPIVAAVLIMLDAVLAGGQGVLLDIILYFGVTTIFVIGFYTSYSIDGVIMLALRRGIVWAVLGALIVITKKMA
jgi:hypothetical protein